MGPQIVTAARGWIGTPYIGGVRQPVPSAWQPGSKPVWFTELGCAALDKGTNQPNKFLDAMSSESKLPHHSNGGRDDLIQQAYIRAMVEHWGDPANNSPRSAFGRMEAGRMVDMARAHVWCWDARPYPAFPAMSNVWADGSAWQRGHWLNGRAGTVPLGDVVAEICRKSGVVHFDVSQLYGVVRGYTLSGGETGRAAIQPLMLAYGFDVHEREGVLHFRMRDARISATVDVGDLAVTEDVEGLEVLRAPDAEVAGRIRLTHIEAGADYAAGTVEAMLPGGEFGAVSDSELPLCLTRAESRAMVERWLAEAAIARDSARFALPPSMADLGPGDVLRIREGKAEARRWRIDRIERVGAGIIDAVRVETGVYRPAQTLDDGPAISGFQPPIPVWPVFLDLPLLRGDEVAHAPYVAATATPWPGQVAAWVSSQTEGGYAFNARLTAPAAMGETLGNLLAARPGVWDRGPELLVRVKGGNLRSVGRSALLSGANALAIGDGSPEGWEVLQFAQARLVGANTWALSMRLRGQAGTDAFMRRVWPAGSTVVLLDGAPEQVDLPPSARDQLRYWRVGPAMCSPDDKSFVEIETRCRGAGLRPLSPCHLGLNGREVTWVRRTRIGGDGWEGADVPLGEDRESYEVRVVQNGAVLSQVLVTQPRWVIPDAVWAATRSGTSFALEVSQLSDQFGRGPFVRRVFDV